MQLNLQRSGLATAELICEAPKRGWAFMMVQEPYIRAIGEMWHYLGARIVQCVSRDAGEVVKAAIVLFDDTIDITQCPDLTSENISVARLRTGSWEIGVVPVYLEPDKPVGPYLDRISWVVGRLGTANVVQGGDLNAHNTW